MVRGAQRVTDQNPEGKFQALEKYGKDLADQITRECLRYLYRLLFLFYVEAREELGYAPMQSEEYRTGYSLESLRDAAELIEEAFAALTPYGSRADGLKSVARYLVERKN